MTASAQAMHSRPFGGRLAAAAGLAGLAALIYAGTQSLPHVDSGVARLEVAGTLTHLNPDQVHAALQPYLTERFFRLDLDAMQAAVERLPWVAQARVGRGWPGVLRVRVWERVPVARWGDVQLLDADGVVFAPPKTDLPDGLPRLSGPDDRAADVRDVYEQLAARLAGTPFALSGLSLNARGGWIARTAGGIELRLGRGDPLAQADRIVGPVARALAGQLDHVAAVDLRYSNGFAVAWREQQTRGQP